MTTESYAHGISTICSLSTGSYLLLAASKSPHSNSLPLAMAMVSLLACLISLVGLSRNIKNRMNVSAIHAAMNSIDKRMESIRNISTEKPDQPASSENTPKREMRRLAAMSHEIRNHLNGLLFINDMLMSKDMTPEQEKFARISRISGEALLHIVNDVLDYSRVESCNVVNNPSIFDQKDIFEESIDIVEIGAREKGLNISRHFDDSIEHRIFGDRNHLRQILVNLLSNAVKFTDRGSVSFSCRKSGNMEIDTRTWLIFEISDTGRGIAPDIVARLFQPFMQAESSTMRNRGTGLGLAISNGLAASSMGGRISVQSTEGAGSNFRLEIPFSTIREPISARRA